MMQLGAEGVFVGSGIFKSGNPEKRAAAIVRAVTDYNNPKVLAEVSEGLGEAMVGINGRHQQGRDREAQQHQDGGARTMTRVGVLAVQGAFREHEQVLEGLGAECFDIRNRSDLDRGADALVIPGGESTVMGKLTRDLGILPALRDMV